MPRCSFVVLVTSLGVVAFADAANLTLTPSYTDSAGVGFNDPTYGAARKTAFQYALNSWANLLGASYSGEKIVVSASFADLGGTSTSATLGQASPTYIYRDFGSTDSHYFTNTFYASPLANHLAKSDISGSSTTEITAQFNSKLDTGTILGGERWYYGTDGNTGSNLDFISVCMHEIGHGLGFGTNAISANSGAYSSSYPTIYEHFLYSNGLRTPAMTDAQRLAAITSNNLLWDGPAGIAANGGLRPVIYAPSTYQSGSSVSHTDETTYPSDLMSPMYSGVDHAPSAMDLGMLSDMGWTMVPEPGIVGSLISVATFALIRRRREI